MVLHTGRSCTRRRLRYVNSTIIRRDTAELTCTRAWAAGRCNGLSRLHVVGPCGSLWDGMVSISASHRVQYMRMRLTESMVSVHMYADISWEMAACIRVYLPLLWTRERGSLWICILGIGCWWWLYRIG